MLDLRDLLAIYSRDLGGRPALDPKGLPAMILYGHATGTASSRGLERALREQIAFRYLCGSAIPDHSTINRFRTRHMEVVADLLGRCLELCAKAGLVTNEANDQAQCLP